MQVNAIFTLHLAVNFHLPEHHLHLVLREELVFVDLARIDLLAVVDVRSDN